MLSTTEGERRLTALRGMMAAAGYEVLIFAGNAEATQRGYIRYLTNWRLWGGKGFAVLPLAAEPLMILGAGSQSHWAPQVGWIKQVQPSTNMLADLAAAIDKLGLAQGTIGVVGLNEVMLYGDVLALQQRLAGATLVDATHQVDAIMAVKSAEELAAAAATYHYIAEALAVFKAELAPGKTERAVMAQAVCLLAEYGCHDGIAHLTNGIQPFFRPPTDRLITIDDIFKVSLEFAGPDGYWIELSGIYSFKEPSPRLQRHFETTRKALARAGAALRPGNKGQAITAAVEATYAEDGWNVTGRAIWDGHAIGQVVIRPPYGTRESTEEFQENMIINVHPGLLVDEDRLGYIMQDNFVVTPTGGRPVGTYQHEWQVVKV